MAEPEPAVLVERDHAVLRLTLNRPAMSNAFAPDLVDALSSALTMAAKDPSVNVVLLTGAGRNFCAGLQLKHLLELKGAERSAYLQRVFDLLRQVWTQPQPIIAAVNGAAMAGGFDLAAFCDVRVAADDAYFAQTEILIGLTQILHPLARTIGFGHAKELALMGDRITAQEAHRIGLVNHVVAARDLVAKAHEMAQRMASRPQEALFATKKLARELLDQPVDVALQRQAKSILDLMESKGHKERLAAYVAQLSKPRV
jgi:enoyl-CoA hydratase/carnithine racemase